jgi:DNA processing protein
MDSWIRFANLQLPHRQANALLERFGSPEHLFAASPAQVIDAQVIPEKLAVRLHDPSYLATESQLDYARAAGVRIVARTDDEYPRNLKDIADSPPLLFVRGRLDEKDRFSVAIVGSRSASPYGKSMTAKLSRDLVNAGLTIVSGGAIGIDSAAHRATVEAGGRTIVVTGCGLDVDYPRENRALFEQIVREDRGALVTEFPLGATPEAWRFPMRNRTVSGLAMGVIVVEAGRQSGALITANVAGEQGREVMAVPGNVDRPGSQGTNGLIRDGATLVESSRDVLQALGMLVLESPPAEQPRALLPVDENQRRLLERLSLTPKHVDAIAAELNASSPEIAVHLTMLELSGLVRRLPGNSYIRVL